MKKFLGCAATAALLVSSAYAQSICDTLGGAPEDPTGPPDPMGAAAAILENAPIFGYRIEDDECGGLDCDAILEGDREAIRRSVASRAAADASGEGSANAPRVDLDADAVRFRTSRRGTVRDRTADQVVYLDLVNDDGSPFYPIDVVDDETNEFLCQIFIEDYVFTQPDIATIRSRVAEDYAPFDVRVVTEEPASGPYARIDYTDNDRAPGNANITLFETDEGGYGFSILFGRAEGIDFGNDDYDNGAFSDVNFWKLVYELFGEATFTRFTGLDYDQDGLATAIRNQAANTGAHEVGHALGLRHHDSFGAPDDGLPSTGVPAPGRFVPVYPGPQNGAETILHTMASGASVGLPINGSSSRDRFFSERSALKLRLAERARVYPEGALQHDRRTGAQRLPLSRDLIPNTIEVGENAGSRYVAMDTAWAQGTLEGLGDTDEYVFSAKRSFFLNAEAISFTDSFIEDAVIPILTLYKVEDDGGRTFVSTNFQNFEPYDPLLVDIEVPAYGDYVLVVEPQAVVFIPSGGGFVPVPLDTPVNRDLLAGDYDLLIYQVDRPLGTTSRVLPAR